MAKLITANKLKRLWQNGVVAKMVAKARVLSSMEEIEANTNSENIAGAMAVAELSNKLTAVRTYVDDDKKLHFVDSEGADSVLNFSSLQLKYQDKGTFAQGGSQSIHLDFVPKIVFVFPESYSVSNTNFISCSVQCQMYVNLNGAQLENFSYIQNGGKLADVPAIFVASYTVSKTSFDIVIGSRVPGNTGWTVLAFS